MVTHVKYYLGLAALFVISCNTETPVPEYVQYSTSSDSTLFYFHKGWEEIMDFGEYGKAEVTYRKALSFDPDFLIGKSVLARLTTDLDERLTLYQELENRKDEITGDERLILDVYIALTHYTNLRDQEADSVRESLQKAFSIGEQNLRIIVHKYPKEVYLKSEYIEVLHSLHGTRASIDSLNALITEEQAMNPFLIGYHAALNAELENFEAALTDAQTLSELLEGKEIAKPDAIFADIYFKMGNLEEAKKHADRAHSIDPRNLDASRLKTRIDAALANDN